MAVAYLMSSHKKAIKPRVLFWGLSLQFVFAFLVLLYIILALESHGEGHEEQHALDEEALVPATVAPATVAA